MGSGWRRRLVHNVIFITSLVLPPKLVEGPLPLVRFMQIKASKKEITMVLQQERDPTTGVEDREPDNLLLNHWSALADRNFHQADVDGDRHVFPMNQTM